MATIGLGQLLLVILIALIVVVLVRRWWRRSTPPRQVDPGPSRSVPEAVFAVPAAAAPVAPGPRRVAHLGVDFGTSNTVAVLQTEDGRQLPMLFDGAPLLPSAVFVADDGRLVVGRDAVHLARTAPERFEPAPKRCIDDGSILLGDRDHGVVDVIAAVLARVVDEARRTLGGTTPAVTLTHPAAWGRSRRDVLAESAARAGMGEVTLVPEPVAAARLLTRLHGATVASDTALVIYDFGGGTFDATVLVHSAGQFGVVASQGLADAGGRDIDAALLAHVGAVYADRDAATWDRIRQPATAGDRRARWTLLDDVRTAKEMLSRTSSTLVHVPLFDDELLVTRAQLEDLARPIIDRTVAATRSAQQAAGPVARRLGAVFLVGGSSRIPLASTSLHRSVDLAPTTLERPETVVAEGAALL